MDNLERSPSGAGREIPLGVCGRCGREVRAWSLDQVKGVDTCLECRNAMSARKKWLIWIGAALGVVVLIAAAASALRYQDYKGSPKESMDKLAAMAKSDPEGVRESRKDIVFFDSVASARDAVNRGPVAKYADLGAIWKQLQSAEAEYSQSTGVRQISESSHFGTMAINTVLGAAKTIEITDQQADTAHGVAVFTAPIWSGLNGEYTARLTLTRTTDAAGTRWIITSLDNAADIIRVYVGS